MSDDTPPATGTELAVVSPPALAGSDSIARLLVRRGIINEAQLV